MFRRLLSTWRPHTYPPLPPPPTWHGLFGAPRERVWLHRQDTADAVAAGFLKDVKSPKTIIEAYPGAGILTRAILQYPPSIVKKVILLEEHEKCLPVLNGIASLDDRVVVIPQSGYEWSTYTNLESEGHLRDISPTPWEEECNIHFMAHIPRDVHGEQLMSQLFRAVPERAWLFKYGRVRLSCMLSSNLQERIQARGGQKSRCKLSVIASATCASSSAAPPEVLSPYAMHFYPVPQKSKTSPKGEYVAVNYDPLVNQFVNKGDMEKWDFILRAMFIRKVTPLKKTLPSLCPGAENLLTQLVYAEGEDAVDVNKLITDMTEHDWQNVVKAFNAWPFAPNVLEAMR